MKEKKEIREEKLDKVAGGYTHARRLHCPDCGAKMETDIVYAGNITCYHCGKTFKVSRLTLMEPF